MRRAASVGAQLQLRLRCTSADALLASTQRGCATGTSGVAQGAPLADVTSRSPGPPTTSDRPPAPGDTLVAFRAHNSSLPYLKGQTILARVVSVTRQSVLVDSGYKQPQRFFRTELKTARITRPDGSISHVDDLAPGDLIHLVVEELETPFGEMLLTVQRGTRGEQQREVWEELKRHLHNRTPVMGRILNPLNGGYAVGIAGRVCFCPYTACRLDTAAKVGVLQLFLVSSMDDEAQNVVCTSADL